MNTERYSRRSARGCPSRRALLRWIDRGGPLPVRLARHAVACAECYRWASRIVRVQGALTLLAMDALPAGLVGRANEKTLRMVARRLRESDAATRLRRATARLPLWFRLEGPLARSSGAAVAAMIILALRASVTSGVEQTRDFAQPLADAHYQRHIDDQGMLA